MGLIVSILTNLISIYSTLIIIFVLMSWLPGAANSWLGRELSKLVMPYLRLFSFIPPLGFLDFSPLIALLILQFLNQFLASLG